jgi:hypothetical protein
MRGRIFIGLVVVLGFLPAIAVGIMGPLILDAFAAPPNRKFPTEATTEDKTAADLQRVASRANDLGEQVDGVGLALVETEDQLRDEIRKLRDDLTEVQRELSQFREEHAKLWILMHTPPVVEGEANPVKEFMEAKRPEVYGFSPWFACPHCETHRKHWETAKAPFDVHWGEIADAAEAKAMGVPENATYPLYKIPTKQGDWFVWSKTPDGLVEEYRKRNN